jgi:hypothetical protein
MGYRAKSITAKASSACKMNMGLVAGAADMHNSKAFVDHGALAEKRIQSGRTKAVTPKESTNKPKDKTPTTTLGEKEVELGKGLGTVKTAGVKTTSTYDTELM